MEADNVGDLQIEFVDSEPPAGVRAYHGVIGQPLRVRVRVHYALNGDLLLKAQPFSFSVGFYLSSDEQIASDDLRLGGVQIEDFAEALRDLEVTLTLPKDLFADGMFVSWRPTYLGAIVDEADEIEESDESNNVIVRSGFLVARDRLVSYPGGVRAVAFSPDGGLLAFAFCGARSEAKGCSQGQIRLGLPLQGETVRVWTGHATQIRALAFSPDGRRLASGADDGTIALWDVATGQKLRLWQGHQDWVSSLAFSPDGGLLASGSWDGTVKLWTAGAGRIVRALEAGAAVLAVAFSPDGRWLASGSVDGLVRLWDVETGALKRELRGHEGWVFSVAFSPDGGLLASSGRDGTVRLWDPASGRLLGVLGTHKDWVRAVAFSPDGRRLASGADDGTITLWDLRTGEVQRLLRGHEGWVFSVAFSPDGGLLASSGRDGTVRLWSGF
jgi:Tol biopolymer transport system component